MKYALMRKRCPNTGTNTHTHIYIYIYILISIVRSATKSRPSNHDPSKILPTVQLFNSFEISI